MDGVSAFAPQNLNAGAAGVEAAGGGRGSGSARQRADTDARSVKRTDIGGEASADI
jgi:hypothetical protein